MPYLPMTDTIRLSLSEARSLMQRALGAAHVSESTADTTCLWMETAVEALEKESMMFGGKQSLSAAC